VSIRKSYGSGLYATGEAHLYVGPLESRAGLPPVVVCHGANGTALTTNTDANVYPAVRACATNDLATLAGDLGGTNTWGNDTSRARVSDAKTYLQGSAHSAKAGGVLLLGISMGALTALLWAKANPTLVRATALLIPELDPTTVHDTNRGGFAAAIEAAYGGLAGWNAAKATHDPSIDAASYTGFPIAIWNSSNDSIGTPAATVASWAVAAGATTHSLGAVGHDSSGINTQQLLDFFAQYA
jgi:pimeloyl-ACP methyl ester carboxylesterase